jgi:hypothetical protein
MAMFDPASGRFDAGTVPAGTSSGPGIEPTGPQKGTDVINTFDFLDAQTFTTLALAGLPRYQDQIDWREPIEHAIDTFAKAITATTDGRTRTYQGFSLVATPTITTDDPDPADGIAWEFTGQVVVALRLVDELYGQTTFETMSDSYLAQIREAQQFAPFNDGEGVVAATLNGENDQGPSQAGFAPVDQDLSTPFQGIPERVGLAATSWAIFADSATDPLGQPSATQPTAPGQSPPAISPTGNFVLGVQAGGLRDLAGDSGVGSSSATWFVSLTVQSVHPVFNRRGLVTSLVLSFSGPLDQTRAETVTNYTLTRSGPDRKIGTRDDRRVSLRSARYREQILSGGLGTRSTVTLTPAVPFQLSQPLEVRINGQLPRGLRDTSGRLLDGDVNGIPGGDFVTVLSGTSSLVSASSATAVPMGPSTVEGLLASGASVMVDHARRRH